LMRFELMPPRALRLWPCGKELKEKEQVKIYKIRNKINYYQSQYPV